MIEIPTKKCPTCHKEKSLSDFWKKNNHCIECMKKKWAARSTPEKRIQYSERQKKADDLNIARYLSRLARRRAKDKGLEFTIRPSDIQVVDRCPILGFQLVKNRGQWSDHSYSLDRVDSTKGYIPGNVRVISWKANFIKNDLTLEQAERMVKYMKGEL